MGGTLLLDATDVGVVRALPPPVLRRGPRVNLDDLAPAEGELRSLWFVSGSSVVGGNVVKR